MQVIKEVMMVIQPGLKISCNGRIGTLGMFVKKNGDPGKVYLMSCWHILDDNNRSGDVIHPR